MNILQLKASRRCAFCVLHGEAFTPSATEVVHYTSERLEFFGLFRESMRCSRHQETLVRSLSSRGHVLRNSSLSCGTPAAPPWHGSLLSRRSSATWRGWSKASQALRCHTNSSIFSMQGILDMCEHVIFVNDTSVAAHRSRVLVLSMMVCIASLFSPTK